MFDAWSDTISTIGKIVANEMLDDYNQDIPPSDVPFEYKTADSLPEESDVIVTEEMNQGSGTCAPPSPSRSNDTSFSDFDIGQSASIDVVDWNGDELNAGINDACDDDCNDLGIDESGCELNKYDSVNAGAFLQEISGSPTISSSLREAPLVVTENYINHGELEKLVVLKYRDNMEKSTRDLQAKLQSKTEEYNAVVLELGALQRDHSTTKNIVAVAVAEPEPSASVDAPSFIDQSNVLLSISPTDENHQPVSATNNLAESAATEKVLLVQVLEEECALLRQANLELTAELDQKHNSLKETLCSTGEKDGVIENLMAQLSVSKEENAGLQRAEQKFVSDAKLAEASFNQRVTEAQDEIIELQVSLNRKESNEVQLKESHAQDIQKLKEKMLKCEDESRQLHLVISQLRQSRKSAKDDNDASVNERNDMRTRIMELQSEVGQWQEKCRQDQEAVDTEHTRTLTEEAQRWKDVYERVSESQQQLKADLQRSKSENLDLRAVAEVGRSDMSVLKYDIQQRELEVGNLQSALQSLEDEKSVYEQRVAMKFEQSCKVQIATATQQSTLHMKQLQDSIDEMKEKCAALEDQLQLEGLLRRKLEVDFSKDKKKMEQSLETAVERSSVGNVVDRTVLANFIVTYIQRNRPKEILQILSKILNFSEEQNVIVGLSVPPPMHIVASLFQGILGINTQKPSTHGTQQREGPTVEVSDDGLSSKTLGELWVSFLLDESDVNEDNRTFKPPKSTGDAS